MRIAHIVLVSLSLAPHVAAQATSSAAAAFEGQLSPAAKARFDKIRNIHEGAGGIITRFRESGLITDSTEWFVAGPPAILPFAGTWRGIAGITEFQKRLSATMRYDKVELREYLVSGPNVAAIFYGEGIALANGRAFHSEILRLYTFRDDKVVKVRNFYDTASYVAAVKGESPQ